MKLNKKAILVISVGTISMGDKGIKIIDKIEEGIQSVYPDYIIYRAFTSKFIINKLKENYNYEVDTVSSAMTRIIEDNITELIIQPTHIIDGVENNIMISNIKKYKKYIESIYIGRPLLDSYEDYNVLADNIIKEFSNIPSEEAVFLIGHGTEHVANSCYLDINNIIHRKGYNNIRIGTIKGSLSVYNMIESIERCNYNKIYLTPLMIVVGSHARNDIFGESHHSWRAILQKRGYNIENISRGLGEYAFIRRMIIEHISRADLLE